MKPLFMWAGGKTKMLKKYEQHLPSDFTSYHEPFCGGGAMFIGIALIVLLKFETKTAIGTSILIMGLAAIPGVVSHWRGGTLQWNYALVILSCSIPATACGSWFANRISARDVKRLLGCYLVVIAPILLYRIVL